MNLDVRSPLAFFAKLVLLRPLGALGVVLAAMRGAVAGMLIPFLVSSMIQQYHSPLFLATGRWLIICFSAALLLEVAERYVMTTLSLRCRKELADYLGLTLPEASTADVSNAATSPNLHRAFAAFGSATHIFGSELPGLMVGLAGFVAVLIGNAVPWPVFVAIGVFLALPLSAYWLLKRNYAFKKALQLEDEEVLTLGLIYAERRDPQVQPALSRHRAAMSQQVIVMRRKANRGGLIHVASRAILRAAIGITAVVIAFASSFEVMALLLVFALTFSGHLSGLYYFAEFFHKIGVDAAPLFDVLRQPRKPPLPTPEEVGWADIDARNVAVEYAKTDGNKITVNIGNLRIKGAELCLLDSANGSGKTTLANILSGKFDTYSGSLNCWGHELREFDPRSRIAVLEQTRRPKPVTVAELFKGANGVIKDETLMLKALYAADAAGIDFNQRHDRLSQGMMQKIDLALFLYRTLIDQAIFLCVIDEPTNHVSRQSAKRSPVAYARGVLMSSRVLRLLSLMTRIFFIGMVERLCGGRATAHDLRGPSFLYM